MTQEKQANVVLCTFGGHFSHFSVKMQDIILPADSENANHKEVTF